MGDMRGFVNPYNFIDFPKHKARAYDEADRHTGVIEYTITTKTPLFIPNSGSTTAFKVSDEVPEHKSYDFFSYTELDMGKRYDGSYHIPVIPGSEIRGVIRTIYETLTDSCMGVLNGESYPVKRSAARFIPALIHKRKDGKMELLEATSLRIGREVPGGKPTQGFEQYHNGTMLYYKSCGNNGIIDLDTVKRSEEEDGEDWSVGYLIKWGMGVRKARYHVFTLKKKSGSQWHGKTLTRDDIERKLKPVLESYLSQPSVTADNKKAYEAYEEDLNVFLMGEEEAYFPVTCTGISGNEIFYLAPAIFSKEVSNHNIGKLAGEFAPCVQNECPACELFGHLGRDNENAKGSRLRFSDMYVRDEREPEAYYVADTVTIPTLAEPKLGNTEFYLKKPEGVNFWTYDYYTCDNFNTRKAEICVKEGQLRGRKYYWHHGNKNVYQAIINRKDIVPEKLNRTIRPVKEEVAFTGKLYFDGISEKQVKQLLWILNSGSLDIGYKLGGAKPYGFGSVVCSVDGVFERTIEWDGRSISYHNRKISALKDTDDTYDTVGFSRSVKADFMKISGLHSVPETVEITYPKTEDQKGRPLSKGYQWFMSNHTTRYGKGMPRSREDIVIKAALPAIGEEDFSLKYSETVNKPGSNNKYGNHNKPGVYHKSGNHNKYNNKDRNAADNQHKPG